MLLEKAFRESRAERGQRCWFFSLGEKVWGGGRRGSRAAQHEQRSPRRSVSSSAGRAAVARRFGNRSGPEFRRGGRSSRRFFTLAVCEIYEPCYVRGGGSAHLGGHKILRERERDKRGRGGNPCRLGGGELSLRRYGGELSLELFELHYWDEEDHGHVNSTRRKTFLHVDKLEYLTSHEEYLPRPSTSWEINVPRRFQHFEFLCQKTTAPNGGDLERSCCR